MNYQQQLIQKLSIIRFWNIAIGFRFGEIDIIAKDDEYIVFVEEKYRKRVDYGYPREAVDYKKRQHILRTAMYYLRTKIGYEVASRFDVIEILETSITHLEAAFQEDLA